MLAMYLSDEFIFVLFRTYMGLGVVVLFCFFFSSRRRHTRCALVTGFRRVLFRSDIGHRSAAGLDHLGHRVFGEEEHALGIDREDPVPFILAQIDVASLPRHARAGDRSEEHTSELKSLTRTSYAAYCLT